MINRSRRKEQWFIKPAPNNGWKLIRKLRNVLKHERIHAYKKQNEGTLHLNLFRSSYKSQRARQTGTGRVQNNNQFRDTCPPEIGNSIVMESLKNCTSTLQ